MPARDFDNDLRRYRARTALVVGASGGIGAAIVRVLVALDRADTIVATARQPMSHSSERVKFTQLDLTDEQSIMSVAASFNRTSDLDLVLVATGILCIDDGLMPEKRLVEIDRDNLAQSFAVNTIGPALVAKHVLPRLARDRTSIFGVLAARVGSIGDNRKGGWYSYRASKAALNMIVKTATIELARSNPQGVLIGLHPGTVDTRLSRPFQARVPDEQMFKPDYAAERLLSVIENLGPEHSGLCFAWDGSIVPP